jgi:hypothetical protein
MDQTAELASEEWLDDCFERLKAWLATSPEPRGTVSSEGYAISFHSKCSFHIIRRFYTDPPS